jgi:hypothetical protein
VVCIYRNGYSKCGYSGSSVVSLEQSYIPKNKYYTKTWDYWFLGLRPLAGTLKNTLFRKLDLFPSSGEGVGATYSVGSVRKSGPQPLDQEPSNPECYTPSSEPFKTYYTKSSAVHPFVEASL